ncbi:MAG: hypothetical protein ABW023_16765 [Sphingomonas sp.]
MMERLEARGRAMGERAVDRAVERLATEARVALPGLEIAAGTDRVTIVGRGLGRRWLEDPALRWLGGLLK